MRPQFHSKQGSPVSMFSRKLSRQKQGKNIAKHSITIIFSCDDSAPKMRVGHVFDCTKELPMKQAYTHLKVIESGGSGFLIAMKCSCHSEKGLFC